LGEVGKSIKKKFLYKCKKEKVNNSVVKMTGINSKIWRINILCQNFEFIFEDDGDSIKKIRTIYIICAEKMDAIFIIFLK
jgi:hypothetical protein